MRKSFGHRTLASGVRRRNPRRHDATMCVSPVCSQPLSSDATKTLNHTQMVTEQRGWVGEGVRGVPPSPGRRWCPAVSPAPCAWSSPAAAASFPGTEPSSLPPLLFSDLGGGRSSRLLSRILSRQKKVRRSSFAPGLSVSSFSTAVQEFLWVRVPDIIIIITRLTNGWNLGQRTL